MKLPVVYKLSYYNTDSDYDVLCEMLARSEYVCLCVLWCVGVSGGCVGWVWHVGVVGGCGGWL